MPRFDKSEPQRDTAVTVDEGAHPDLLPVCLCSCPTVRFFFRFHHFDARQQSRRRNSSIDCLCQSSVSYKLLLKNRRMVLYETGSARHEPAGAGLAAFTAVHVIPRFNRDQTCALCASKRLRSSSQRALSRWPLWVETSQMCGLPTVTVRPPLPHPLAPACSCTARRGYAHHTFPASE
jgi:hypothetical protein